MPSRLPAIRQTFTAPGRFPYLEVRTTLESTQPYAEHFHSAFSFGFILEGGTCFTLLGQPHTALKGDIVLIAPGLPHSCNPLHDQPRSYHMAYLDAAWFAQNICRPLGFVDAYAVVKNVVRDPALFRLGLAAIEALCSNAETADQSLAAWFAQLQASHGCLAAVESPGAHDSKPTTTALLSAPGAAGRLLAAAANTPNADRAPVTSLARRAGLRRESFSRAFRRTAGLPPKAWLHCLRLEKARALLRQGKSIAEAALAAGYADQSHFHRMFVKFYSVTPGCYQRGRSHSYNTRK